MPIEIKPQYRPKNSKQKLGYLIEECGEVMAAVGKSIRWGLPSFNPELPKNLQVKNGKWIMTEFQDLKRAIQLVEDDLNMKGYYAS